MNEFYCRRTSQNREPNLVHWRLCVDINFKVRFDIGEDWTEKFMLEEDVEFQILFLMILESLKLEVKVQKYDYFSLVWCSITMSGDFLYNRELQAIE